jgi:predicted RNA-binding Zn ribbon-like protein
MARTSDKPIFGGHTPLFRFIGHYACLDFVNTEANKSGEIKDLLLNYDDLIAWLASAKLFTADKLTRAFEEWRGKSAAGLAFKQALELRNCLDEMSRQIVRARSVSRATLQAINAVIERPSGTTRLVKTAHGFERRFDPDVKEPTQLLIPIGESAAELLCHGDLSRVKRCSNSGCGAYFYDSSKNRKRRWCTTTGCGNRMRVAAFYERQRRDG